MKFTEEQYQKIVDAWDNQNLYKRATQSVIDELKAGYLNMGDQALALANPLTREWAHDKFVEKEKKYVWQSKNEDNKGLSKQLYKSLSGMILDYSIQKSNNMKSDKHVAQSNEKLTESEIRAWGYNPEMFDREEVQ